MKYYTKNNWNWNIIFTPINVMRQKKNYKCKKKTYPIFKSICLIPITSK